MKLGFFTLKRSAMVFAAALLAMIPPAGAQQQGPIVVKAPPGAPAVSPLDTSQTPPGVSAPGETTNPKTGSLAGLPSWLDRMSAGTSEGYVPPPALPLDLPEKIALPAGTRIPIVLVTSLSSQFSHRGQPVIFRTTGALALSEDLQVPPGVEIRGRVAEVTRPGAFGKSGALRVTVDRMVFPGGEAAASLQGQLRSAEINSRGRMTGDVRRPLGRQGLIVLSLQGALAGAQFGGKAAAVGASAGAAVAAVLMMSQKGKDVSVSAGTPFSVRLQQDADLPASAVFLAQQDYASRHPDGEYDAGDDFDNGPRPVLKRRAPVSVPQP